MFFRIALPCSGGLSPGERWDTVVVNCIMGATTDVKGQVPSVGAKE